jgi:hypothetical protein
VELRSRHCKVFNFIEFEFYYVGGLFMAVWRKIVMEEKKIKEGKKFKKEINREFPKFSP